MILTSAVYAHAVHALPVLHADVTGTAGMIAGMTEETIDGMTAGTTDGIVINL